MNVPFVDLTRVQDEMQAEIDTALSNVFKRGIYVLGRQVTAFEKEFSDYLGVKYTRGVASGTDALKLAIQVLDIGEGDEVIVPANAYPTAFPVAQTGATVVLVDARHDGTLDVSLAHKAITKRTRAILPVHLYGNGVAMADLMDGVDETKIVVIEDVAQAHGLEIKMGETWKKAGSISHIGCFSFYPTKNLGAFGDGGLISTRDAAIAKRLSALRMYGEVSRYKSAYISGVSRLDEIHAAMLRVKLKRLDVWNSQRARAATLYRERLADVGDIEFVNQEGSDQTRPVHHLFVIRTKKRDALKKYLTARDIGSAIHYPRPIHLQESFAYLGYKKGDFPISEALSRQILSLPLFPGITEKEIDYVIKTVQQFYS